MKTYLNILNLLLNDYRGIIEMLNNDRKNRIGLQIC